jgi:hypothetical protein
LLSTSSICSLFGNFNNASAEIPPTTFAKSCAIHAELTRTERFPRIRQKERVKALVELFTSQDETAQVVKAR